MKYKELYSHICDTLSDAGIADALSEARIIMRDAGDIDRTTILMNPDENVDDDVEQRILDILEARRLRIPLQHILGKWNFMGLDFEVSPDALIPRADTEIIVECAMKSLSDGMRILDLCTGTGCILISLLKYSNDCTGIGVDISHKALDLARSNAGAILPDDGRVDFLEGDLYTPVSGEFDIIVSNPPYIPSAVIETLEPEVKDHEPRLALDGGTDGLDLIRRIVSGADEYLIRGGYLFIEIGYDQGEAVSSIFEENGYRDVQVLKDLAGLDRVVCGMLPILS